MIFALVFAAWLFVMFTYRMSVSPSATIRILMLMVQFALLFFGNETKWLAWMSVINFDLFKAGSLSLLLSSLWFPILLTLFPILFFLCFCFFKVVATASLLFLLFTKSSLASSFRSSVLCSCGSHTSFADSFNIVAVLPTLLLCPALYLRVRIRPLIPTTVPTNARGFIERCTNRIYVFVTSEQLSPCSSSPVSFFVVNHSFIVVHSSFLPLCRLFVCRYFLQLFGLVSCLLSSAHSLSLNHRSFFPLFFAFLFLLSVELRPGESYLAAYPAISCQSPEYTQLLPLFYVLIALIVCALPIVSILFLYLRRRSLTLDTFRAKFGVLYEYYLPRAYYYESIIMLRRVVLIALIVFFKRKAVLYSILSVANLLFMLLHLFFQPFVLPADNKREGFALCILTLITILLAGAPLPLPDSYAIPMSLMVISAAAGLALNILLEKVSSSSSCVRITSCCSTSSAKVSTAKLSQVATAEDASSVPSITSSNDVNPWSTPVPQNLTGESADPNKTSQPVDSKSPFEPKPAIAESPHPFQPTSDHANPSEPEKASNVSRLMDPNPLPVSDSSKSLVLSPNTAISSPVFGYSNDDTSLSSPAVASPTANTVSTIIVSVPSSQPVQVTLPAFPVSLPHVESVDSV
jgi:hypothetical protein